ncbi:MAG TPA: hypothetical protein VM889_02420, partial [Candidatus Thermoplasmatota archaeon]|nr:hypothetical protein [Candidatus Thermoplasmatota archaeon]
VDCNPTGYADYCPKSGNYLELDTMDVYYWDTGSADVREEFRAPTLTNTGAKADAYFPYVWTWPYINNEPVGPNAYCLAAICPAARVAVVGPHCVDLHASWTSRIYVDGVKIQKPMTSSEKVGCGNPAVTFIDLVSRSPAQNVCFDYPIESWVTFDLDDSKVAHVVREDYYNGGAGQLFLQCG